MGRSLSWRANQSQARLLVGKKDLLSFSGGYQCVSALPSFLSELPLVNSDYFSAFPNFSWNRLWPGCGWSPPLTIYSLSAPLTALCSPGMGQWDKATAWLSCGAQTATPRLTGSTGSTSNPPPGSSGTLPKASPGVEPPEHAGDPDTKTQLNLFCLAGVKLPKCWDSGFLGAGVLEARLCHGPAHLCHIILSPFLTSNVPED